MIKASSNDKLYVDIRKPSTTVADRETPALLQEINISLLVLSGS